MLSGLEDFGITLVESQACGTPVIAYGSGGAAETVIARRTGILFKEQTTEAILEASKRFNETKFDYSKLRGAILYRANLRRASLPTELVPKEDINRSVREGGKVGQKPKP